MLNFVLTSNSKELSLTYFMKYKLSKIHIAFAIYITNKINTKELSIAIQLVNVQ